MAGPKPRIDAAQFERVATTCRWSDRSLAVARALLVDGASVADTATAHDMSAKQARVLMTRFIGKAEQYRVQRLQSFMQREPPRLAAASLEPFKDEVRTLRTEGYTIEQVIEYLKQNGVTASPTSVRKLLRSIQA